MLMKVVLPAPLVPIRPTTESCSMAALTSAAAVTAPKVLHRLRALRTTGTGKKRPDTFGQKDDEHQKGDAEGHLPGVGRQVVGGAVDHAVEQGAGERREHVARAGEDGDEDELARRGPVGHVRV